MDDLVNTFKTMRKFGTGIVAASQQPDMLNFIKSDPRMPRQRLRSYLGQYGMRGAALYAEVRRIAAGPLRKDTILKTGIYHTWPYGWEPADFTPMMRRIFKGKSTRRVVTFDELSQVFAS